MVGVGKTEHRKVNAMFSYSGVAVKIKLENGIESAVDWVEGLSEATFELSP